MKDLFDFPTANWDDATLLRHAKTPSSSAVAAYLPTMTSDYWRYSYLDTGPHRRAQRRVGATALDGLRAHARRATSSAPRRHGPAGGAGRPSTRSCSSRASRCWCWCCRSPASSSTTCSWSRRCWSSGRQGEIALLKSRGATTAQVMQIYVIEGLAILLRRAGARSAAGRAGHRLARADAAVPDLSGGAQPQRAASPATAYLWAAARRPPRLRHAALAAYQATQTHGGAAAHASAPAAEAAGVHALLPRPRAGRPGRRSCSTSSTGAAAWSTEKLLRRAVRRPGAAADAGVLHPDGRHRLPASVPAGAARCSPGWCRGRRARRCSSACGSSCATRCTTRASCCC